MVAGIMGTIYDYLPPREPYSDSEVLETFIVFHILFLGMYCGLYFSL